MICISIYRSVSIYSCFPFGFEGRIWDLIVSVPDHCLCFYFDPKFFDLSTDVSFIHTGIKPFVLLLIFISSGVLLTN